MFIADGRTLSFVFFYGLSLSSPGHPSSPLCLTRARSLFLFLSLSLSLSLISLSLSLSSLSLSLPGARALSPSLSHARLD